MLAFFKESLIGQYITVFIVSMVPLIELRGAIPVAVANHLNIFVSYVICIIGNMLPVPLIYLFARKVLVWGSDKPVIGKFFSFCLEKGKHGGEKLQAKAGNGLFIADDYYKQITGTCQFSLHQKTYSGVYKAIKRWFDTTT